MCEHLLQQKEPYMKGDLIYELLDKYWMASSQSYIEVPHCCICLTFFLKRNCEKTAKMSNNGCSDTIKTSYYYHPVLVGLSGMSSAWLTPESFSRNAARTIKFLLCFYNNIEYIWTETINNLCKSGYLNDCKKKR